MGSYSGRLTIHLIEVKFFFLFFRKKVLMWNCCVAKNELHSESVEATSDVTHSKDYGE
jgi:hypothetical protein